MSTESELPDGGDYMHDLMVARTEAVMPYDFRKKTGLVTEIIFVAVRTMELVNETLSVAGVLHGGLEALRIGDAAPIRAKVFGQIKHSQAAKELFSGDSNPLLRIILVNLCAALEVGVEDTIIVSIRFIPAIVERLASIGVKNISAPKDRDLTYEEARGVLMRLEEWRTSELKKKHVHKDAKPPQGWLLMLGAVGLNVAVAEDSRKAIREMIYLRNCILHRAGRADSQGYAEGDNVQIEANRMFHLSKSAMGPFSTASIKFARAIFDAAERSHSKKPE